MVRVQDHLALVFVAKGIEKQAPGPKRHKPAETEPKAPSLHRYVRLVSQTPSGSIIRRPLHQPHLAPPTAHVSNRHVLLSKTYPSISLPLPSYPAQLRSAPLNKRARSASSSHPPSSSSRHAHIHYCHSRHLHTLRRPPRHHRRTCRGRSCGCGASGGLPGARSCGCAARCSR